MTNVLHCTACGIQGKVKCNCGEPYARVSAHKAAELGIAAHPDWSDRKIANACGVSQPTVGAARSSSTDKNLSVEKPKRIGRDGKQRAMPKPKAKPKKSRSKIDIPPAARNQQFTPQEEWESSLIQLATFILTMDKVWTEKFGDWKQFQMTACTHNAIARAGVAWKGLVDAASPKLVVNNEKEISDVCVSKQ